jgi:hypothetical protein
VFLDEGRKSRVDVRFGGGGENKELLRDRTRRCLDISDSTHDSGRSCTVSTRAREGWFNSVAF